MQKNWMYIFLYITRKENTRIRVLKRLLLFKFQDTQTKSLTTYLPIYINDVIKNIYTIYSKYISE